MISKDLFLSILAMDSYNQGYESGVSHGKTDIGAASVGAVPNEVDLDVWQTSSFYALSYDIGSDGPEGLADKRVISYRGTDNIPTTELLYVDAPIILGSTITRQLEAGADFRDAVGADPGSEGRAA